MLRDMIEALATPAPLAHRRLGCVADSVRTGSRSRRCQRAWAPHLAATRAIILAAAAELTRRRRVVVLGSGRLDDVPLAELAETFTRVSLVDAVHPLVVRKIAATRPNVEMITADLSGSFGLLLGRAIDLETPLPPVCSDPGTDLVVSANLLSQLPIRPVDRLEVSSKGFGRWRPEDGEALGREIVSRHLRALSALPARVCLVTDVDETEKDRQGRVLDRIDLLHGVTLGEPDRNWAWELAPFGETARNRRLIHRVVGFSDWRPTVE